MKRLMICLFSVVLLAFNVGNATSFDNDFTKDEVCKYDVPTNSVDVVNSCEVSVDAMDDLSVRLLNNYQVFSKTSTYCSYLVTIDTYKDVLHEGYGSYISSPPDDCNATNLFKTKTI